MAGASRIPSLPSMSDMDAMEAAGRTLPRVDETGRVIGVVPPASRKYTARYEAVDLATATQRMLDRKKGKMAVIKGGIDDPKLAQLPRDRDMLEAVQPADSPDHVLADLGMIVQQMVERQLNQQIAARLPAAQAVPSRRPDLSEPVVDGFGNLMSPRQERVPLHDSNGKAATTLIRDVPEAQPEEQRAYGKPMMTMTSDYLNQRHRVSFTVAGGTYSVPVIDVVTSLVGLVILLPVDPSSATFTPSLGSEVTVEFKGQSWDCFFPGVAAIIEPMKVQILTFVFRDDKQGGV